MHIHAGRVCPRTQPAVDLHWQAAYKTVGVIVYMEFVWRVQLHVA